MFTSRTGARFAACATVTALALVPAVHAQSLTLNTGDVVTVDGTGTHGTVNNATKSYSDSSNYYAVQTNGTAAFTLTSGGTLTATGVNDYGLFAQGRGPITISGGSVTVGNNGYGLYTAASSPITISGGTITAGDDGVGLLTVGSGPITISGGSITAGNNGIGLYCVGSVTLTGGSVTTGKNGIELLASQGLIDLYGAFDGLMPGQTQTLPGAGATGSFFGTLENNSIGQTFTYKNYNVITLHDVAPAAAPEPSQFAAFAVGLLGLGALTIKAKKRTA